MLTFQVYAHCIIGFSCAHLLVTNIITDLNELSSPPPEEDASDAQIENYLLKHVRHPSQLAPFLRYYSNDDSDINLGRESTAPPV